MKWFRFWDDALDNPKIQKLPARIFKNWVNMLCLASKNKDRGTLPPVSQIAFRLRLSITKTQTMIDQLIDKSLIELHQNGCYSIHEWNQYQFQTDDAYSRVLKKRKDLQQNETFQKQKRNVSKPFHETAPDTDTDTDTEQNHIQSVAPQPAELKTKKNKDDAYELWADEFLKYRNVPYLHKQADFVQLHRLRKSHGLNGSGLPKGWDKSIQNYLSSPLASYTLADLCCRYDCFFNGEVDRYGKPVGFNDIRQANKATVRSLQEKGFFDE
jgi:hypothetical protein